MQSRNKDDQVRHPQEALVPLLGVRGLICWHTALYIYRLNGEVPKTLMAGDTADIINIAINKVLTWHWPLGGDVEGSGVDFKSPARSLHHLPQIPPRILGRSRHRYCHPRG